MNTSLAHTHTQFDFTEVPDGNDIIAACRQCAYEIMHVFETGQVRLLNPGDLSAAHSVSYIPRDGLQLTMGLSGEKGPDIGAANTRSQSIGAANDCGHPAGDPGCSGST
jgi:hypothetical protein